ncbi:flagellar biosynthesis protein FlhB [Aestuariispira ectoiniformans]|uniref:flagellar biosynthesis protein FlhB n=1 Tax=Aestuariispira ectoiniformans TaxID=2775080 RepID=UPI00223C3CE6|nr:flagellar biosynthesis protein FlhB [Aestuariispira ectoiniformans]
MSDSDSSDKTEEPTSKRLSDARKKGQVPMSRELNTWMMLFGVAIILAMMAPGVMNDLKVLLRNHIEMSYQLSLGPSEIGSYLVGMLVALLKILAGPFLLLVIFALFSGMSQNGILFATEQLKPKLNKISPIAGAKKWFSVKNYVEFLKGILKITIVGIMGVIMLAPEANRVDTMPGVPFSHLLTDVHDLILRLLVGALAILFIITIADIFFQRFNHTKQLRMTKQEVKEEFKNAEGDPHVKGRLRQIRAERARQRMMQAVPEADVVVTNPTHFAVALAYKQNEMDAPKVVAKGQDVLAFKIREIAEEHDVAIVENPPLARALYASVEIDEVIPEEHYKAVAEVISYVFSLKNRKGVR